MESGNSNSSTAFAIWSTGCWPSGYRYVSGDRARQQQRQEYPEGNIDHSVPVAQMDIRVQEQHLISWRTQQFPTALHWRHQPKCSSAYQGFNQIRSIQELRKCNFARLRRIGVSDNPLADREALVQLEMHVNFIAIGNEYYNTHSNDSRWIVKCEKVFLKIALKNKNNIQQHSLSLALLRREPTIEFLKQ